MNLLDFRYIELLVHSAAEFQPR